MLCLVWTIQISILLAAKWQGSFTLYPSEVGTAQCRAVIAESLSSIFWIISMYFDLCWIPLESKLSPSWGSVDRRRKPPPRRDDSRRRDRCSAEKSQRRAPISKSDKDSYSCTTKTSYCDSIIGFLFKDVQSICNVGLYCQCLMLRVDRVVTGSATEDEICRVVRVVFSVCEAETEDAAGDWTSGVSGDVQVTAENCWVSVILIRKELLMSCDILEDCLL